MAQAIVALLQQSLDLLIQQFEFKHCVIRILETERMTLTVRGQEGISSKHLGESERKLNLVTYIGTAFLTNTAVVINDTGH